MDHHTCSIYYISPELSARPLAGICLSYSVYLRNSTYLCLLIRIILSIFVFVFVFRTFLFIHILSVLPQFCADVMEELDSLLPLAVVCKEDTLLPVSSCYIEVSGRVSSDLLTRLEERAREVPHSSPLENLPTILASSTYIYHRLAYYESQLGDTNRT